MHVWSCRDLQIADWCLRSVQAPGFLTTLVQRGVLKLLDLMKVCHSLAKHLHATSIAERGFASN